MKKRVFHYVDLKSDHMDYIMPKIKYGDMKGCPFSYDSHITNKQRKLLINADNYNQSIKGKCLVYDTSQKKLENMEDLEMDDCKMGNEIDIINFLNLNTNQLNSIQKLFKSEGPLASRTKDFVTQKVTDDSDSKEQR